MLSCLLNKKETSKEAKDFCIGFWGLLKWIDWMRTPILLNLIKIRFPIIISLNLLRKN